MTIFCKFCKNETKNTEGEFSIFSSEFEIFDCNNCQITYHCKNNNIYNIVMDIKYDNIKLILYYNFNYSISYHNIFLPKEYLKYDSLKIDKNIIENKNLEEINITINKFIKNIIFS